MIMPPSIGLGPTRSIYSADFVTRSWPDPEMVNTDVTQDPDQWPRAVREMVERVQPNGWTVRITHAKGSWPGKGRKPSRARHSYAVRLSRGEDRAVAVYVEGPSKDSAWKWDTLYRWTLGEPPAKYSNVTSFNAVV